jgi:hypothetical protein
MSRCYIYIKVLVRFLLSAAQPKNAYINPHQKVEMI